MEVSPRVISLQRSIGHQWEQAKPNENQQAPAQSRKRITFRKNSRLIYGNKTSGTPYFVTLKPLNDIESGHINKVLIGLTRLLRIASAKYIYTQECEKHEETRHLYYCRQYPGERSIEVEVFAEVVKIRQLFSFQPVRIIEAKELKTAVSLVKPQNLYV